MMSDGAPEDSEKADAGKAVGSVTLLLTGLRQGDRLAAILVWQRYYDRLVHLARKKLQQSSRRVADEEDVVLSAFEAFCRGTEHGRFPQLDDRDDLWQVLVMLTARKAANQIKHLARQKRGGGALQGESVFGMNADAEMIQGLEQVVGNEPSPEFAALTAESCGELLARLKDDELRQIALAKLEGYTNDEIAKQLRVKTRTIERKLQAIRETWS